MEIKLNLPARVLIGLSGGADSMALAWLAMQQGGSEICAVHVNHGLRGAASDEDEAFVRDMCSRWRLPLLVYRAEPPEHPGEDWARQVRYGFFHEAMQAFRADAVALAHHRDDQAETFLLHLLRGAGSTGLCGMAPESEVLGVRVIRPLLDYSRQELRAVLTEVGIPWREDASNGDTRYLRNALRHELLPLMEQLAPGAARRIAHTAELIRQDDEALDRMAQETLQRWDAQGALPLQPLRCLPDALLHRVLRLWWTAHGVQGDQRGLTLQQTQTLAELTRAGAGSKCNLPGGMHAVCGWTHLHLAEAAVPLEIRPVVSAAPKTPGDGRQSQAMPRALYAQCILRTRQTGDWISPYGLQGRQSLQDYFVNKRVDAPFRDQVPLLCRGSEVLLAAGVGAGAIPPMDETDDVVLISWEGAMPWLTEQRP